MMTNFWQKLKHLFAATPVTPNEDNEQVLLHELLERTKEEQADFYAWQASPRAQKLLDWLHTRYAEYLQTKKCKSADIDFLCIPSVNGFVLHFEKGAWSVDDFQHLFDYLSYQTKKLGYWSHLADLRSVRRQRQIETTQRYYLKPPRTCCEPGTPADQYYGNVMVTLNLINEKLINLKFCATSYSDRNFKPARDFAELMDLLCKKTEQNQD